MGCNCGKRKKAAAGYVNCVKCGKKLEKDSSIVKKYWIECAKCIAEKKMLCGVCAFKQGLKLKGGTVLTEKWYKIRDGCIKAAEKKAIEEEKE